jgi:hypothetical protein
MNEIVDEENKNGLHLLGTVLCTSVKPEVVRGWGRRSNTITHVTSMWPRF